MLTNLPTELTEQILLLLDPLDIAHAASACRLLWTLVYNAADQALWREMYLRLPLDDPRTCVSIQGVRKKNIDWKAIVQNFVMTRGYLYAPYNNTRRTPEKRLKYLRTLIDLITWLPPLSSPTDFHRISNNLAWVYAALCQITLLNDDDPETPVECEERQLSAQLHTYFGLTELDQRQAARVRSRAFVYNMWNYKENNLYGPLNATGTVNWVHMQALQHIVAMHLVDLQTDENFEFAIFPMSLPFTQIVQPELVGSDEMEDWAGVEGEWKVSFCFCDHRELLRYNESDTEGTGKLDISIFQEPDFGEVFRTLSVNIKVENTEYDEDYPTRRTIHFSGEMPDSTSNMHGIVKMTPDGQVQWQFHSGEQQQAIWYSLGIQVGGLRSAFGVVGSWTTIFHDSDDPVGPFWLRKRSVAPGLAMDHVSLNASHVDQD